VKYRTTLSGFSRWIFWTLCRQSYFGLAQNFFFLASRDVWSRFFFRMTHCKLFRHFFRRPAVNYPIFCRSIHGEFSGHYFADLRSLSLHFVTLFSVSNLDSLSGVSLHEFSWCFVGASHDEYSGYLHDLQLVDLTWFRHATYWTLYFERILLERFLLCIWYIFQVRSHGIHEVHWKKTVPFCQLKHPSPISFLVAKIVLAHESVSTVGSV